MARRRLIRDEPSLPGGGVLVRALLDSHPHGGVFDRDVLVADVAFNFELFGYYGLSLWRMSRVWPLERVLAQRARGARRVALMSVRALRGQGLGLVPSGKTPHYDASYGLVYADLYGGVDVTAGSAEELVDRFINADYTVKSNAFYEQDPELRGGRR